MGFFSLNMLEMAIELATHDRSYEDYVAEVPAALPADLRGDRRGRRDPDEMWDEEDGFFYDVLRLPDGDGHPAEGPLHGGAAPARA